MPGNYREPRQPESEENEVVGRFEYTGESGSPVAKPRTLVMTVAIEMTSSDDPGMLARVIASAIAEARGERRGLLTMEAVTAKPFGEILTDVQIAKGRPAIKAVPDYPPT